MKKHLQIRFITTSVLLALLISAPYFSGILIEKQHKRFASQLPKELKFNLELKEYQRNFFTSTAIMELQVLPNENKTTPYVIPIEQTIIHGPFVFDLKYKKIPFSIALAHIHNKLSSSFKAKLTEIFNNDEPFSMVTRLGFFGKSTTYFSGIATKHTTKTNFAIVWGGIEGKITHSLDFSKLNGKITAPQFSVNGNDFKFEINNIDSKFNTAKKTKIAVGSSALHIGELTYQEKTQPVFNLSNLDINSTLDNENADPQTVRYSLIAKIANSQILKQSFAENAYLLTAKSITPEFFTALHAGYEQKFALLDNLLRELLENQASLNLSIPKYFTQSLIAFCNLQLYKNSIIGQIDPRPKEQIFGEIVNNIAKKFDHLITNKILVEDIDAQQYTLMVEFNKTGQILLNGEKLQNPLQALKDLEQTPAVTSNAEPTKQEAKQTEIKATEKTTDNAEK